MSSASRFPMSETLSPALGALMLRCFLGLFRGLVDAFDLVFHRTAWRRHVDRLAGFTPDERASQRRLVREARVLRIGIGRTDDRKLVPAPRADLFDFLGRAVVHFVGDIVALIDD